MFVVRVWGEGNIERTDTECYCVCCEGLGGGQYRQELILNVTVFVVRVWR